MTKLNHSHFVLATIFFFFLGCSHSLRVYSNGLENGFEDWSWGTVNLQSTTQPHGGTYCFSLICNAWEAAMFHSNIPIELSQYVSIRFWVRTSSATSPAIYFTLKSGSDTLADRFINGTGLTTTWQQVTVNLLGKIGSFQDIVFQANNEDDRGTVFFDDVELIEGNNQPNESSDAITVTVSVSQNRRAINKEIYGVNFAGETELNSLAYPLNRYGGNSITRYSWTLDAQNSANDWFFVNSANNVADVSKLPNGTTSDRFVQSSLNRNSVPLIQLPLIGWSPKTRTKSWSYSVAKYGAQQRTECDEQPGACAADAGNGISATSGARITNNDPNDCSIPINETYSVNWMKHLIRNFGDSTHGGVKYYSMDNEVMLWSSSHVDIHPNKVTYDEVWQKTVAYATAVKAADPGAKLFGPVTWGWCDLFNSDADGCGCSGSCPDKAAHGNKPFLEWYAGKVCEYANTNGVQLIDFLDVHYYPQSGEYSDNEMEIRLHSIKSLYNPTYRDVSWMNDYVNFIPRVKKIISDNCPSLKISITEYNWGGIQNSNLATGALAQAEVLAIFGREGVDLAARWTCPEAGSKIEDSFRMYLNYDKQGSNLFGTSVGATSSNVDSVGAYAIHGDNGKLFVLLFNKKVTSQRVNITLSDTTYTGQILHYAFNTSAKLGQKSTNNINLISSSLLSLQLDARSANLLVLSSTASTTYTSSTSNTGTNTGATTGATTTVTGQTTTNTGGSQTTTNTGGSQTTTNTGASQTTTNTGGSQTTATSSQTNTGTGTGVNTEVSNAGLMNCLYYCVSLFLINLLF